VIRVLVRLAGVMMVSLRPLAHLRLEHGGGDAGRVVEHQLASVDRGRDQHPRARDRDRQHRPALAAGHATLPEDSPQRDHREDAQGDPRQLLVSRHDPVDRLAVGDVLLGLEPRQHGQPPADRPGDQRPEPGHPERRPVERGAGQVEHYRDQQQGGREVVEGGVQAGPVVAEHWVSSES
jgi:hypothetical protein